jgi:hypothetical protein
VTTQPKYGDQVTVKWPGGFHDFEILFGHEEPVKDGWVTVYGRVIKPSGPQHDGRRSFYARQTGPAEYTMLPHRPWSMGKTCLARSS